MARRRHHKRHRSYNKRRRSRNPLGSLSSATRPLTSGFNLELAKKAFFVVGGSISNNQLTQAIGRLSGSSFFKSGVGSYITGLLGAGIIGMGARKVLPGYAAPLFFGAVLDVVSRATNKYIMPFLPSSSAMKGLGNYFDVPAMQQLMQSSPAMQYANIVGAAQAGGMRGMGEIDYFGEMSVADELGE